MNDIPEYLANIRYMCNELILQLDKVHHLCCRDELDVETVRLNISDLRDQMNDIQAELKDMHDTLEDVLSEEDGDVE